MANYVNIIAWNVRGLGDASKRHAIFQYCAQFQPAILCFSETHLLRDTTRVLHKPWLVSAYHSVYSSHARGVSVLVHKNLPFQCTKVSVDPEGRCVCLLCSVYNISLILVAVYIPPPYSGEIMKKILSFLDPHVPSLLIGDFNNYLHPYLDKFHSGNITPQDRPTSLSRLIAEVGLCDVWRVRHPETRQFSCYSSSHNSLSRIDLALGSDSLLPLVDTVEYLPRSISDHSPVRVRLQLGLAPSAPRPPWRLNPFWTQLIGMGLLTELREFFTVHAASSNRALVWDTMKAVLRGLYIRDISRRKSKTRELMVALQKRVAETEVSFTRTPTSITKHDWEEAQKLLKEHMLSVADNKRFFLKQKYFMEGESAGHLLSTIVRSQEGHTHVSRLVLEDGREVTEGAVSSGLFCGKS